MGNKKILFFKPGAIGDLLHTLPSLRALRIAFPAAHVTIVVSPGLEPLIEGTSIADRCLVFDKERMKKSARSFIAFAMQLRRERYDLFVDMQPSARSRLVRWLSGPKRSLVYKKQRKPGTAGRLHAVDNFMRTLAPIGVLDPVSRIELPVKPEAVAAIDRFLAARGISRGKPLIAMNCSVGSARPARNWPPERFTELAGRLIREFNAGVVFIGGSEDAALARRVAGPLGDAAVSAAGELNLAETAALLSRCRCLVSSDTGPLHLATAVQTPVIGLYGSTDPLRTGPVGGIHRVLRKELPCVPCEKKMCPLSTQECMSAITADQVLLTIKELFKW